MPTASRGPLIALDGRLIGYTQGIAQYTRALAASLVEQEGPERFQLWLGRRSPNPAISTGPRLSLRRAQTPPHHRLERLVFPLELLAQTDRVALLHSVDHVAPAWGPWRSVVTLHDLAFALFPRTHSGQSRAYYRAAGLSARRAHRVIAVSRQTALDAVRLLGLDGARVSVVYEAAAPGYSPRPHAELTALAKRFPALAPLDVPYVLFVGTLEARKNVPLLLDAIALVREHIDVRLVLVGGPGWEHERILRRYDELGLGPSVVFLGPLPENDLAVLYSHATVFALPSLYEGFGLPILEAMACGAPVVASNAGPIPEVAGDAAVLLPPDDARVWADALAQVVSEPARSADLRARGLVNAARFSWDRAAEETLRVYREALAA